MSRSVFKSLLGETEDKNNPLPNEAGHQNSIAQLLANYKFLKREKKSVTPIVYERIEQKLKLFMSGAMFDGIQYGGFLGDERIYTQFQSLLNLADSVHKRDFKQMMKQYNKKKEAMNNNNNNNNSNINLIEPKPADWYYPDYLFFNHAQDLVKFSLKLVISLRKSQEIIKSGGIIGNAPEKEQKQQRDNNDDINKGKQICPWITALRYAERSDLINQKAHKHMPKNKNKKNIKKKETRKKKKRTEKTHKIVKQNKTKQKKRKNKKEIFFH